MKTGRKYRPALHSFLIPIAVIGLSMATGCGGGSSSGGGIVSRDDNIFNEDCRISDPGFPFCGKTGCRNEGETLYGLFEACPPGWTGVPEGVRWPELHCRDPQGKTFQVDADQCPPGWTEITIDFL